MIDLPLRIVPPTPEQVRQGRSMWGAYGHVDAQFHVHEGKWIGVTWIGPSWGTILISDDLLHDDGFNRVMALPWRLQRVCEDYFGVSTFARTDGWHILSWLYWRGKVEAKRLKRRVLRFFWKRGLLHTHEGAVPQWRDVEGCWTMGPTRRAQR